MHFVVKFTVVAALGENISEEVFHSRERGHAFCSFLTERN
jgi:hypothetical protein